MPAKSTNSKIHVLLIDDDEDAYVLCQDLLAGSFNPGFILEWEQNPETGRNKMQQPGYDLILIDNRLGALTGTDLIREAREKGCDIPMILLTGKASYQTDIEAMKMGATDYLEKDDLNTKNLERAIRYALNQHQSARDLKKEKEIAQTYLEVAPLMFLVITPDERVKLVNPEGCKILGLRKDEVIGKNWFDTFVPESHREDIREKFTGIVKGAVKFTCHETPVRTSGGEERLISWNDAVILDEENNVTAVVCAGSDITSRVQEEIAIMNGVVEGLENERKRISREIHDGVGTLLSTISLYLERIKGNIGPNAEEDSYIRIAIGLLRDASRELRNITRNINPTVVEDFGLLAAVEDHCQAITGTNMVEVRFSHFGITQRPPFKIELNLYRIIQELLNNAVKHANCTNIQVQLIGHPDSYVVTVDDNGIGFDANGQPDNMLGNGLKNIASRARALGGSFNIETRRGQGTLATVEIPVQKE